MRRKRKSLVRKSRKSSGGKLVIRKRSKLIIRNKRPKVSRLSRRPVHRRKARKQTRFVDSAKYIRSYKVPTAGFPAKPLFDSAYNVFVSAKREAPKKRYRTVSVFALVRVTVNSADSAKAFAGRRKSMIVVTRIQYSAKISLKSWTKELSKDKSLYSEIEGRAELFNSILLEIVGYEGVR